LLIEATCAAEGVPSNVDKAVIAALRANEVVGASWVTVSLSGEPTIGVYGVVSSGGSSPVTRQTRFRAGSFSKNLTALLSLRLHAAGVIDIDTPLRSSAVINRFGDSANSQVTIASLLEHTGGLPGSSYRDYATGLPDGALERFLSEFGPFETRWRPQRFFSYSNPGYGVVGAALETASGRTFDELMRSEVFTPLGLESASFQTQGDRPELVATGHDQQGRAQPTWAMLARPAGGLVITASDLARVVQMYLRRGALQGGGVFVPQELIERMERGETSAAARAGVREASYGLGNFGFAVDGRLWRGHWGKTDGFLTNVGYSPEHGVGFVLLVNTDAPAAMAECRSILAAHLTRGLPSPARDATSDEAIDPAIGGWYANATHDMPERGWLFRGLEQRKVRVEGSTLRVASYSPFGWSSETHRPVATGGFMPESLPRATAAHAQIDGRRYWLDGEAFVRVSAVEAHFFRWLPLLAIGSAVAIVLGRSAVGLWGLFRSGRPPESRGRNVWSAAPTVAAAGFLITFGLFVRFGLLGSSGDLRLLGQVSPLSIALAVGSLVTVVAGAAALPLSLRGVVAGERSGWRLIETTLSVPLFAIAIVWALEGWAPLVTWR
jgi:CubicO group peptidase (beta-lactamase class C family)